MKINEDLIKQTINKYSCTNLPVVSGATHNILSYKIADIAYFEVDALWVSQITKDVWVDCGYVASDVKPTKDLSVPACFTDSSGRNIGYGRLMVTTAGKIRIKSNITTTYLTGVNACITYFINMY